MTFPVADLIRLIGALYQPSLGAEVAPRLAAEFVMALVFAEAEVDQRTVTCNCGSTLRYSSDEELGEALIGHLRENPDHLRGDW